jgi:hypothetical protein
MIDSGWIAVSAFGIALLTEGGAPDNGQRRHRTQDQVQIRERFHRLRPCCCTPLALFNRLFRCKIAQRIRLST